MTGVGSNFQIAPVMDDPVKDGVVLIKVLREIVTAELCASAMPPLIEWHRVGVTSDGIRDQSRLTVGWGVALPGHHVDTLVLDENDGTTMGPGFDEHRTQIGSVETDHDDDLQKLRKAKRVVGPACRQREGCHVTAPHGMTTGRGACGAGYS
jgi:hypothetical protein